MAIQESNSLKGAVITASNQTRKKSIRLWYKVLCTGRFRKSSRNEIMVEVKENQKNRWLNMNTIERGFLSTFNGLSQLWENGKKIDQNVLSDKMIKEFHETITII
ncbi:hypothetical protein DRQ07_00700 [candidate division KSB1 bacterium]|nr:MAG: hypothetical protein DRQ07_00700 [candidate division KSB1 bacterium]